ncbi:MAG TPA: hypothetical protein VFA81_07080 [Burkholderiales bacterium]|nr:hypothetical protein [Burkholderiales bacterium]
MRTSALLLLAALAAPAYAVSPNALLGTWEAARTPDDERMYVRFLERGKAEIIAEYDFQLPGAPSRRRGRSTTFGKWSVKGDNVELRYAKVRDRLHYSEKLPLSELGLDGTAAGLKPAGQIDPNSRVRMTLWKAPHDYKLKAIDPDAKESGQSPAK